MKKQGGRSPPSTRAKGGKRRGAEVERKDRLRENVDGQSQATPPPVMARRQTPPRSEASREEVVGLGRSPERDGQREQGPGRPEDRERAEDDRGGTPKAPGGPPSNNSSSSSTASAGNSPNPSSNRKTATFKARVPKKKYTYEHCSGAAPASTPNPTPAPASASSHNSNYNKQQQQQQQQQYM
ncbi:hypothetical protein AGOR_G00211930 [Albula goreensis]|uniref:Uncharacterized protein n=1 Tax=Albula goreensis TaxID=1534307 RepID=A0A8T3CUR2_9TELE|nr:hypothetical protein AGOR_G00211930 [Albula goreensis]